MKTTNQQLFTKRIQELNKIKSTIKSENFASPWRYMAAKNRIDRLIEINYNWLNNYKG